MLNNELGKTSRLLTGPQLPVKKHYAMLWGGIRRQTPQLMCSRKLDFIP